jgi:pimeloyl-ACP methyl ester carboxylesterase
MTNAPGSDDLPVAQPRHHFTEPDFIEVNGLQTAYRRRGQGEPVLFLHGAGMTRMWLPMYARCAESVDFIAPEHPGFGATARPDWLEGFDDLVVHYDELLAKLGIDEVHLIGYSLGGWIAAEFASYFPRRIKSFTLITPIGLRVDDPGPDTFKFNPPELLDHLFNDKSAIPGVGADSDDFEEIVQLHAEAATFAKLIWAPRYNLALEHRLKRVTCPALIVKAENDRLVSGTMADRYAELLPNSQTVTVSETGHAIIAERPNETADAITVFIMGAQQ